MTHLVYLSFKEVTAIINLKCRS